MDQKYQDYLSSPEWKLKREKVISRCLNVCERCHSNTVEQVHHLTYENIFNEPLEDLMGLCRECHKCIHGYADFDIMKWEEACETVIRFLRHLDYKQLNARRVDLMCRMKMLSDLKFPESK